MKNKPITKMVFEKSLGQWIFASAASGFVAGSIFAFPMGGLEFLSVGLCGIVLIGPLAWIIGTITLRLTQNLSSRIRSILISLLGILVGIAFSLLFFQMMEMAGG